MAYILRLLLIASAALSSATVFGSDLPCSIERIQSTNDGVAIRFSEKMFWNYKDSTGKYGIIGVGGVVQFIDLPNGREDVLPKQRDLQLTLGAKLVLSEKHSGCVVEFDQLEKRTLQITSSSFFFGQSKKEIRKVVYE